MAVPLTDDNYREMLEARRETLRLVVAPLLRGRGSLTLEVGCGHGHLLAAYAAVHPDRFCVGVDIMAERIRRAQHKRDRARLPNLEFIRADALDLLDALPPETRVERTLVLFPDPWPKRRHWKNRILRPEFLDALAARSPAGAILAFRTDHAPYFAEAEAAAATHPLWELVPGAPWPFEHETIFQSRASGYNSWIARRRPLTGPG
jgi:tRNA (guanine-N7-)-methyltransferase